MRSEHVTYTCDACGKTEDAEIVSVDHLEATSKPAQEQAILPRGWIKLGAKVRRSTGGRPTVVNAECCSPDCAAGVLEGELS